MGSLLSLSWSLSCLFCFSLPPVCGSVSIATLFGGLGLGPLSSTPPSLRVGCHKATTNHAAVMFSSRKEENTQRETHQTKGLFSVPAFCEWAMDLRVSAVSCPEIDIGHRTHDGCPWQLLSCWAQQKRNCPQTRCPTSDVLSATKPLPNSFMKGPYLKRPSVGMTTVVWRGCIRCVLPRAMTERRKALFL